CGAGGAVGWTGSCLLVGLVVTWEVQRFDGWYNNLARHPRGAAGSPLMRLLPARYSDGVYLPVREPYLPNPRSISSVVSRGPSGLPSSRNQTVLSVFFGYHVVFEILDSRRPGCPPEFMQITVPKGDAVFDPNGTGKTLLPFQRGQWDEDTGQSPNNPRTQVNHVTAWIDGSSIYGSSSSWCDALRSFSGGRLATGSKKGLPKMSSAPYFMWNSVDPTTGQHGRYGLYEFGNARGNENMFTVAEGIIWFRYHNYLASQLQRRHPSWSDEELFQNARKRVIATLQVQTMLLHFHLLGYQKYVDPGISPEFQAAAMRFGYSMVPPGVYMRNWTCHYRDVINFDGTTSPAVRLCNSFWNRQNPNLQTERDVDDLMMGMASQIAEREDNIIVEDLRGICMFFPDKRLILHLSLHPPDYVYGPMKFSRSDLVALTVQRGRDYGLPSYNQAREALNLHPVNSWEEINPLLYKTNNDTVDLAELYNNDISKLELFPGGVLESLDGPGPVFSSIILDQFTRIRNGDRFWFENSQNGLFTATEVQAIRSTTFHDVLVAVTSAEPGDFQKNVFFWRDGDPCPQPRQITAERLQPCTNATSFDYFSGSQVGFGITVSALFLLPPVSFLLAGLVAYFRKAKFRRFQKKRRGAGSTEEAAGGLKACEWQGPGEPLRQVELAVDSQKRLQVLDIGGSLLRSLHLGGWPNSEVLLSSDHQCRALLLKVPKEYDLVLLFENESARSKLVGRLRSEAADSGRAVEIKAVSEQQLLKEAVTKEQRARLLETFFRHAFAQVKFQHTKLQVLSRRKTREALECELTWVEFADALGLKPDSLFVESMFTLADKDGNGYLSFQEFLDIVVIFMKGSPEEKSKLMFSMHDISGNGFLSKEEFSRLFRSFIEMSSNCLSKSQAEEAIQTMMQAAGFNRKEQITWEDFHFLLQDHENELQFAQLNVKGERGFPDLLVSLTHVQPNFRRKAGGGRGHTQDGTPVRRKAPQAGLEPQTHRRAGLRTGVNSPNIYVKPRREKYNRNRFQQEIQAFKRFVENYRRHIVCFTIFYGITAGVTLDRCYCKSFGIPETSAVGLVVSRGSAAAISFLFPYLLLTVCRNLITLGRETFLNRYIPFDAAIDFHRWVAMSAIILTVVHCLGHLFNIYIFSISNLSILACLFPRVFVNDGSELPQKWSWWFFETVPGITGILLLIILAIMYVFATHYFRRISFQGFWITHYLYMLVYILTVIHGSYGLIQEPQFYIYLIPPGILFLVDKLISLNRKKVEITVLKAELLPSGVLYLEFKRPYGFTYRSGQWVRVACLALGTDEYHPFTLTSAPHEETLSLHIRAVGPWTSQLREAYGPESLEQPGFYPKLYLDGPFGEGHQEWKRYEVSVLVGAGIGVTPFTSILKDLVFKSSTRFKIRCKKVYFIWVTRTQRQFEWVSDVIREVEEMDTQELVSVHIYITQLAEKFDLRTTMLYVCERHFQKLWNRSLFTGLRAITHFGRPPFSSFLSSLQEVHPEVGKIGVFSCGPPGLTKNMEKACQQMNKRDRAHFVHHYENF
uniref:NAD(P)H oxidase (H2O2-forming) n=1 Tax=Scleropages formosus TaxID=113540 RepID=A0A8C9S0G5_SCLFO